MTPASAPGPAGAYLAETAVSDECWLCGAPGEPVTDDGAGQSWKPLAGEWLACRSCEVTWLAGKGASDAAWDCDD